jgi:hypothetical protein
MCRLTASVRLPCQLFRIHPKHNRKIAVTLSDEVDHVLSLSLFSLIRHRPFRSHDGYPRRPGRWGFFLFDPAFATGRLDIILHHAAERVGKGVAPLPFFLHRRIEPDDNITIAIDFWRAVGAVFRRSVPQGQPETQILAVHHP